MRRIVVLSWLGVWASGCVDDGVQVGGDGGSTAAADDADDDGDGSDDGPGGTSGASVDDGTAAADDDTGAPEDLPPPPATGLQVVEVTFDQGIRVPIARDSQLVGPADRNQPILRGRPAVLRAFYETDPGFATRALYGVLTVEQIDGTVTTYESFVNASEEACDGWLYECRYGSPTGAFSWRIPGDAVAPGMTYSIELFETSPGHEHDVSDKIPVFPTDGGTMPVGVEESYMKMRVVIVPFHHALGPDCSEAPDLNEEFGTDYEGNPRTVADYFGERLLAHNPVDEVEMIVHDVVEFGGSLTGSQLLFTLQQLRASEGAPPEYYYYGVARPCDGGPDFSGVAQLGGPFKGESSSRVGWGVYHQSISTTANTFVHEIGHEQGRSHIRCSGDEAGVDTAYPDHPEGDTESWGIDVMAQPVSIQPPSSHDYMTYCGQTWVSEWGYSKVLPWIAEISSWERTAAPEPEGPQTLLHGRVAADGTSQWFIGPGWFDDATADPDHRVRMYAGPGLVQDRAAIVREYERSEDLEVIVPIPEGQWPDIDDLELVLPLRHVDIDREAIEVVGAAVERLATP